MDKENRVEVMLRDWRAEHPASGVWRREQNQQELEFFDRLWMAFRNSSNAEERETLVRIEAAVAHLKYQLEPDLIERFYAFVERVAQRAAMVLLNLVDARMAEDVERGLQPQWMPKGLSSAARAEKEGHLTSLIKDLRKRGLSGNISEHGRTLLYYGSDSFELQEKRGSGASRVLVTSQIEKSDLTGKYYTSGYDMTAYRGLTPDREAVGSINVRDLDARMGAIDWAVNYSNASMGNPRRTGGNVLDLQGVNDVFRDLGAILALGSPEARKIHDQLAVKYFAGTPNSGLVENFDEIKKAYEHKVHVDLSLGSAFPVTPDEALKLLTRGSITRASDPGGLGQPWLSLGNQQDSRGYYEIVRIPGSEKFSLHAGLAETKVMGFPDFTNEDAALRALARGETIKATLRENGEWVDRIIVANPEKGRVSVDWIRSEQAGLLRKDEQLNSSVHQYKDQQRILAAFGGHNQKGNAEREVMTSFEQAMLFKGEPRGINTDHTNISVLERQLLEIGARPGIAGEILEKIRASGEGEVLIPYAFERDGDQASAQLRFKRDTDLDWVRLHGFDVHVNFGNGDQKVSQRFYYNSEDATNSFSLSEAYNLLKGNPVARTVVDIKGQQKEVWRQLAFDKPMTPGGNHVIVTTAFDLGKALNEYPKRAELEKALGKTTTIDSLIMKAKGGETPHFAVNLNGTDEMFQLRVLPGDKKFEIVRSSSGVGNTQVKGQTQKIEKTVKRGQEEPEVVRGLHL